MLGKIGGKRRKGQQMMRWLDDMTDWMDLSLSKFQELVMDREASRAAVHGFEKSWTQLSDCTKTKIVTRDKKRNFIMIKGVIHHENITVININAHYKRGLKCIRQKLT